MKEPWSAGYHPRPSGTTRMVTLSRSATFSRWAARARITTRPPTGLRSTASSSTAEYGIRSSACCPGTTRAVTSVMEVATRSYSISAVSCHGMPGPVAGQSDPAASRVNASNSRRFALAALVEEVVLAFGGNRGFDILADPDALRRLIRESTAALVQCERENPPQAGQ